MWWQDSWSWWWPGMLIEMIIFWGLIAFGLLTLFRYLASNSHRPWPGLRERRSSAEETLAERFARGEIDSHEYLNRLQVLLSSERRAQHPTPPAPPSSDRESTGRDELATAPTTVMGKEM